MSASYSNLIKIPSRSSRFLTRKSLRVGPFSASLDSIDSTTGEVNVIVSRFSHLYDNFTITDGLPVIGLGYAFPLSYPKIIYLEVFYDRNGNAICPKVVAAEKWPATVVNPRAPTVSSSVYPNEIELITKYDISMKVSELETEYAQNTDIQNALTSQINSKIAAGTIDEVSGAAFLDAIIEDYSNNQADLRNLINNLNDFFTGSSALRKKQLRSYTLIAYTTQEFDSFLPGILAKPKPIINPAQTTFTLAATDRGFKIVQSVTSDLVIVDTFYQDVMCKIPIPKNNSIS